MGLQVAWGQGEKVAVGGGPAWRRGLFGMRMDLGDMGLEWDGDGLGNSIRVGDGEVRT